MRAQRERALQLLGAHSLARTDYWTGMSSDPVASEEHEQQDDDEDAGR